MNAGRISIHVCTRDRHSEVSLLIQSLRTQSYQAWDLLLLDDASGTPITNCQFLMYLINRIKIEGHKVKVLRNDISNGVCAARNRCIEEDDFDDEYVCRLDDDVIIERNYLEDLKEVLYAGYDIASGVTPQMEQPEFEREVVHVGPIINKHAFDGEGNLIQNNDDCGLSYSSEEVLPTHQFRSNALYKKIVTDSGIRYPKHLTPVGFREEGWFSVQALLKGFKIGVNTGAKAYHFRCPSGGTRRQDYAQCVQLDDETFRKWMKEMFLKHGDFLK